MGCKKPKKFSITPCTTEFLVNSPIPPSDLNDNFVVKRELKMIAGRLSLNYGKYMAAGSLALLTAKNLDPQACENAKLERQRELDKNL